MRIYDNRVGRFLSVDPLTKEYPHYSPYQFAGNKPIVAADLDGLEEWMKTQESQLRQRVIMRTDQAWIIQQSRKMSLSNSPYRNQIQQIQHEKYRIQRFQELGYNDDGSKSGWMKLADNKSFKSFSENLALPALDGLAIADGLWELKGLLRGAKVFNAGFAGTGKIRARLNSADAVNATFVNKGYEAPYGAATTIAEFETPTATNFVRLSGPNNVQGAWFTTMDEIKGLSPAQLKDKFSLKYEPTQMTPVSVAEGATIRVGTAAPVKSFNTNGGGFQIELLKGKSQYGESMPLKN